MPSQFMKFVKILTHSTFFVLFIYACYFAILGGSGLFFGLIVGLWGMYILMQSRLPTYIVYTLCMVISCVSAFALITHLSLIWISILHLLIIFNFHSKRNQNNKFKLGLACLILLGLISFGYTEHRALDALKQHNASFETGESWQKLGAL